jgi:hypothetical protein
VPISTSLRVFATPYDVALDSLRRSYSEPEGKLILAILDDAIACFQKYALARDRKGKILFQEAEDWSKRQTVIGHFHSSMSVKS